MKDLPRAWVARVRLRTVAACVAGVTLLVGVGAGARALSGDEPSGGATTAESGAVEPTTAGSPTTDSTTTEPVGESGLGSGDDNVAVGSNTRDGGEVYAVRLKIVQTDAAVVDSTNAAVASASCNDCTTVAVAIEGVLVVGTDVEEVTPVNLAIALNSECSGCQTLAAAYQYVTQNDTRVRITPEGRQKVASLRHQLNTLRLRDLTIEEVAAEVDRIAVEFRDVLVNEVVPLGELTSADSTPGGDPTEATTGSSTSATPTDTASATPTGTPSTAPPTESPTSEPSPGDTASDEPTRTSTPDAPASSATAP